MLVRFPSTWVRVFVTFFAQQHRSAAELEREDLLPPSSVGRGNRKRFVLTTPSNAYPALTLQLCQQPQTQARDM
ncbi:hypothetical protein BDN71DRAFT_1458354 [Pleurotus eryngii]|uniref:Uncharacterized protein n=1 Tax=Pleurotus eryngii TaxID=5323 RepID=A0A9P5ZJ95_PLEER|nr:hypothetical protein BDN71DRAFT_1458354 [Pleurotus eryngii]